VTDLLGLLDAAIAELDPVASSRCSRLRCTMEGRLGTDNSLIRKPVPAVPVVPVRNPAVCRSITDPADAEGENGQDCRARESHSRRPGTTGTAGTDEGFCGFPVPTGAKENGNEWEHGLRETVTVGHPGPIPGAHAFEVGTNRRSPGRQGSRTQFRMHQTATSRRLLSPSAPAGGRREASRATARLRRECCRRQRAPRCAIAPPRQVRCPS
jgi:hypothetical protein